jgi:hypothetical protein
MYAVVGSDVAPRFARRRTPRARLTRARNVLIALLAGLLLAVAPASATAGTLDQSQTLHNAFSGIDGPVPAGGFSTAQTVTPAQSGLLDQVDLYLHRFASASQPLTVEIRDVSGGVPGSNVLASTTVPAADVPVSPSTDWVTVTFESPALAQSGTPYAIVVYASGSDHYGWGGFNGDPYAGGAALFSEASPPATWGEFAADFMFKTYVFVYPFDGFLRPIDNLPVTNTMKAGAAVPVKFSLGGDRGLGILAAGSPSSQQVGCNSSAPLDEIEQTSTAGGSSLQYDALTDTYTYVWKTQKAWAGQCRRLSVKLADGTVHEALFSFR